MSGELIQFGFEGQEVRVHVDEIGNLWWVTVDVCKILGIVNSRNVIARLDPDQKGVRRMDTLGGMQDISIVNEHGLYRLIFRSNKPDAQRFQKWVFSEVLPSIRKTGKYEVIPSGLLAPSADEVKSITDKHLALGGLFRVPEHVMLTEASKELEAIGVDIKPYLIAAPGMNHIPKEEMWLEPTELGMRLNLSGRDMNKLLERMNLQYRSNSQWLPTLAGERVSFKHAWKQGSKSGYNLKWNVDSIERLARQFLESEPGISWNNGAQ